MKARMKNTEWHYTNVLFNKKLFKSQNVNITMDLFFDDNN